MYTPTSLYIWLSLKKSMWKLWGSVYPSCKSIEIHNEERTVRHPSGAMIFIQSTQLSGRGTWLHRVLWKVKQLERSHQKKWSWKKCGSYDFTPLNKRLGDDLYLDLWDSTESTLLTFVDFLLVNRPSCHPFYEDVIVCQLRFLAGKAAFAYKRGLPVSSLWRKHH